MMKRLLILFLFFIADIPFVPGNTGINAVIGDESFYKTFGTSPLPGCPGKLRVQTHLAYVEQLLRAAPVNHLDEAQQKHRSLLLDQLHRYTAAGAFPENKKFPGEHRPCFIDARGNICAVGYLIEQSAGRALAEKINADFQYAYIGEIINPGLEAWISWSGLSAAECAMIQPSYGGSQRASVKIGNDSLVKEIQQIDFGTHNGRCEIEFTIKYNGRFKNPKQVSGDKTTAKKLIRYLRKQNYTAASEWGWGYTVHHHRRFLGIRYRTKAPEFSSRVKLEIIISSPAEKIKDSIYQAPPSNFTGRMDIRGTVRDKKTKEPMPFAKITLVDPGDKKILAGTSTDMDGNYILKLSPDTALPAYFTVTAEYIGYHKTEIRRLPRQAGTVKADIEMQEGQHCESLDCIGVIRVSRKPDL